MLSGCQAQVFSYKLRETQPGKSRCFKSFPILFWSFKFSIHGYYTSCRHQIHLPTLYFIFLRIYSSCIFVPHRWIMLFVRSDWLVRKWIASTILLLAADETKWRVKSLISDHFSVYWKKLTNFFTFLCGIYNFSLKCRWRWWIFTSTSVYSC